MQWDDESRDYDVKKLKELDDERFKISLKKAVFSEGFYMFTIVLELLAAYLLCPRDLTKMKYILGLPVWFFVATCIALISWAFVMYHNSKISKDFSLDAKITEENNH
jgi:uncharacterized membrane protein YhdT